MNILERRMFAQGDSVQSFSPAVIDYAQKLGIDPTGKSSNELQAEINLTLRAQTDAQDSSGIFGVNLVGKGGLLFDPTDPVDVAAAGLTATGIGAGAGLSLKLGNTARKIKKLYDKGKQKVKKIPSALNPAIKKPGVAVPGQRGFQPRNPYDPRSYNYKNKLSTAYGTAGAVGVQYGFGEDEDAVDTSAPLIPENIDKELQALNEKEQSKIKAKSEADKKRQEEKNKKLRLDKEIIDVENIISYVQDQDKAVSEQYQRDKQEKNNRNRNIFMEQMSAALAGTDNLGDGIAIGAANAAKAVGDIEESERLAYQEFLEKEESKNKLKEDTTINVIEKYSEQVSDLDGSMYVVGKINELQELYKVQGITGATGWLSSLGSDFVGFFNAEGEITDRQAAKNIVELLKARMVTQLLGEKGKTISDADRKLVENLIGNLQSPVSNVNSLVDLLNNVKETLNNSIRKQSGLIQAFEARYGARIPELEIIKNQTGVDVSGAGSATDEAEVQINQDDVIQ